MNTNIETIQANLQTKVGCTLADIEKTIQASNHNIFVAQSDTCLEQILSLRQHTYERHMPDVNYKALEPVDYHSIHMYTKDNNGNVVSAARLVLDSVVGFAEDYVYRKHIQTYRDAGQKLAEWGRCIVTPKSKVKAVDFALAIKDIANNLGIQHLLIFNRRCDVARILKTLHGSQVLEETDISLGGKHTFVAMMWSFVSDESTIYDNKTWTDYAQSFMTVTSTIQAELFKESAKHLSGSIVDCGAGCAKIAPYLRYRTDVSSYTAIDASATMCRYGEQVLSRIGRKDFVMLESFIEDHESDAQYDSAVSLNSLYTWPNVGLVLKHIHGLLKPNAHFVLATINSEIDMERLIQEGEPDLLMHPDVEKFRAVNKRLALNTDAKLFTLDETIKLIHDAKFSVLECHNRFYMGGLNYFLLKRCA